MPQLILISGCSGGGKSTLLDALDVAGHHVVPEPGRRIVASEQARGGRALPWVDMSAFARLAIKTARADLVAAQTLQGPVFFDRGLVDAAVALERTDGVPLEETLGSELDYSRQVFLAPPWPELFEGDDMRRHGLEDAIAEYDALVAAFDRLGYKAELLPKMPVEERLDHILRRVEQVT